MSVQSSSSFAALFSIFSSKLLQKSLLFVACIGCGGEALLQAEGLFERKVLSNDFIS